MLSYALSGLLCGYVKFNEYFASYVEAADIRSMGFFSWFP